MNTAANSLRVVRIHREQGYRTNVKAVGLYPTARDARQSLPAWQETLVFTERKRAAVLWTEKLTLISLDYVSDKVYERVRPHFADEDLANLMPAIVTINAWNRFGIGFRDEPGY